ncbi:MAG TPA: hypothetical protein VMU69_21545 [Bradyrhizobium sp.]|nr:hypothetical protein [Bradyrhizobium sp.]
MNYDATHAGNSDKGPVVMMVVVMMVMMAPGATPRNDNHVMMVMVVMVLSELNTSSAFCRQPCIVGDQQFGCICNGRQQVGVRLRG